MSNSIKYDNTEILTSSYIPRFVKHESATERELNFLSLARDDGSVLVSHKRGVKVISLQGILTATTQALLETAIDSFKELFSREGKNLDLSWGGSTRRYVATCRKHDFNRDHFHLKFVPWTAEFAVPSGVGEDTAETIIVNKESFTGNYKKKVITLSGSADPKIKFQLDVSSSSNRIRGIELKNTDNGEKMFVHKGGSIIHNETVEIDARLKTVKIDGVSAEYIGMFPNFNIGTNNIMITLGDVVAEEFSSVLTFDHFPLYGSFKAAQGFRVPYTNSTFSGLWLNLAKIGSPDFGPVARIETDNEGEPSGSLVTAGASGQLELSAMIGGSAYTWYYIPFSNMVGLSANTPYWIVVNLGWYTGSDISNYIGWGKEEGTRATYKKGNAAFNDGSWTNYPDDDARFKICYGGFSEIHTEVQEYSISQIKRFL